ncbi:uncharacterized protein [Miscanthus floridulus]|uniref:uncharacterized protein n=1 Tax=Miscanthus floridulus TaxID=154761 RepID=UPI0034577FD5
MADAEVAGAVEQPVLTLGEGSSALVWALETQSLGKSVFLWWERDVWDQLQWQKGLLAGTNELLLTQSAEVEDLRLRCADAKVKELEEEFTCVAGDWDAFRFWAEEATTSGKALAGQLGAEQSAHQLTKGALDEALTVVEASWTEAVLGREASRAAKVTQVEAQCLKEKAKASQAEALRWKEKAEASQVEARRWEQKAKESKAKVTWVAEASVAVQAVLETEIREHEALKSAARTAYEALEVEGVQSGSSLGSRLIALSDQVRERLRGALHTGVKRALAVITSHYIGVDLQAINNGYVLPDDDEEADEAVAKLMEAAEGLGTALANLFEEEVVAPPPSANAGGLES